MNLNTHSNYSLKYLLLSLAAIFALAATVLIVLSSSATTLNTGLDPNNPIFLEAGLNQGSIEPHTTYWYSLKYDDFTGNEKFKDLQFTMFATPSDGNLQHLINFSLYNYGEIDKWNRGEGHKMANFGAGMLVSRDGDDVTAERTWAGNVISGDLYLLGIRNDTDIKVDFWLYDQDLLAVELPAPAEQVLPDQTPIEPQPTTPPVVIADGAVPDTALALQEGVNRGWLKPGEITWYRVSKTDFNPDTREDLTLTMITTPTDGNQIRHITFDVFTAGAVKNWQPGGDNSQIRNVGTGSVVFRDDNPWTGERIWQGWLVDNDQYFIQIQNGTDLMMDYWLFTADVYGPELD